MQVQKINEGWSVTPKVSGIINDLIPQLLPDHMSVFEYIGNSHLQFETGLSIMEHSLGQEDWKELSMNFRSTYKDLELAEEFVKKLADMCITSFEDEISTLYLFDNLIIRVR